MLNVCGKKINKIILKSRVILSTPISKGTLTFSSSDPVSVSNFVNGVATVRVSERTVSWVKFEILEASTNAGLSSFEVYYVPVCSDGTLDG
jgi:hypothetical protein